MADVLHIRQTVAKVCDRIEVMEGTLEKLEKGHGGARPGAGMPKGKRTRKTLEREAAKLYLIRRVEEDIEELTTALLDKAKTGDIQALKEALDRAWGKAMQSIDHTTLGDKMQPVLVHFLGDEKDNG